MKKIIIILVILVLSTILVYSGSMVGTGVYTVEIYLTEGWNLVAGTIIEDSITSDSEIKLESIHAMWYYSPLQKKYIQVHPSTDWDLIM